MADTPGKAFPALRPTAKGSFAKIDPEGNVTATWRTWIVLAGAVIWLTMTYMELRSASSQVTVIALEVQKHREVLIKAGLLTLQP